MMRDNAAQTIRIDGKRFRDREGRHVILRGVNLGGDCKVPFAPDGHTYRATDFSDHRTVSFVGRPFPLAEADAHFARLARWGFNCLRLLTTWEAIEHSGPGAYDEAYLDYFAAICRRAGDFGFHVFIDFHQDAWSRMSGGDGAPGWTFEAAGLDFTRFDAADAAHVMQYRYVETIGGRQDSYPVMSWGSNYRMPANAIMWTLFFAGEIMAPSARCEGVNVGRYLREHYLGAMRVVAERLADQPHVIGFDTLNEPGSGWMGQRLSERGGLLRGAMWSPLDGLAVAAGITRELPLVEGGSRNVNHDGVPIWLPGREDPFLVDGVWDLDGSGNPVALKEDHFAMRGGEPFDIARDAMQPFYEAVAQTIRGVREEWLLFAEADPFAALTRGEAFPDRMPPRTVNASHWYDLGTLVSKKFQRWSVIDPLGGGRVEGRDAILAHYTRGLARIAALGDSLGGGAPTLIGEFGIPYDLNDAAAYLRWAAGERNADVWEEQTAALGAMYDAIDALLLSSTQWNYTASNRNDAMVGDGWNQEDLSIWSPDQVDSHQDPDAGARALQGFCRPYVRAAQGDLISHHYDAEKRVLSFIIQASDQSSAPTQVFVPPFLQLSSTHDGGISNFEVTQHGREIMLRSDAVGECRFEFHFSDCNGS